jgi:hypothetical protein
LGNAVMYKFGRTNTYTVLDELHVFGFDDIYNDFYDFRP